MFLKKKYLKKNVYDSAIERFEYIFNNYEQVVFSLSAGKDSSITIQLGLEVAEKLGKLPLKAVLIDLEGQYKSTIEHGLELMDDPRVEPYWICLPLSLRNAVSVYQPQWVCWDPSQKDLWIREIPNRKYVISDQSYFPFFKYGMEFEDFTPKFGEWISKGIKTCFVLGLRGDESINRLKMMRDGRMNQSLRNWISKSTKNVDMASPIYDWKTEDIWTAVGKYNLKYNKIYDLMYMAGTPLSECRICQPYGDDQRKGLHLFAKCEPETWFKVVNRVSGANFGAKFVGTSAAGNGQTIILPNGYNYQSYTLFLLETSPKWLARIYQDRINSWIKYWEENGENDLIKMIESRPAGKIKQELIQFLEYWKNKKIGVIPDKAPGCLESKKMAPSWKRICKMILKNDIMAKSLSYSGTPGFFIKYKKYQELYGE